MGYPSVPDCALCATYQHDASYHDDEDRYPSVTATLTCSHGVPLDECPDRDAHHERYPSVTDEP